jgi:hypothetical protein
MKYNNLLIFMLLFASPGCDEQAFYSAFPPEGYFNPVLIVDLEPDVLNYSGGVIHKYSGDYSISLSFEKANPTGKGYALPALHLICSYTNDRREKQIPCGNSLLPYWGEESGVSIGIYSIPATVQKGEEVTFSLEFLKNEELEYILESYGKVSLMIKKWSDL